jgi:hypothetical protein
MLLDDKVSYLSTSFTRGSCTILPTEDSTRGLFGNTKRQVHLLRDDSETVADRGHRLILPHPPAVVK